MAKNYRSEVDAALEDVDFDANYYQVQFETTKGTITLDLYDDVAPGHCRNIVGLAKVGYYDGIVFHRVIPGFMNQAGCPDGRGTGGPGYTIDQEFNDRPHEIGSLSMARTNDPNSAGSQFFLCTARVPHLDNQYTNFGMAADEESKAVIMAIGEVQTGPNDRPIDDVTITKASVLVRPKG